MSHFRLSYDVRGEPPANSPVQLNGTQSGLPVADPRAAEAGPLVCRNQAYAVSNQFSLKLGDAGEYAKNKPAFGIEPWAHRVTHTLTR